MNITICSNTNGGVFTYTINLAKELASRGYDVNVFFLTQSDESKNLKNSEHIRYNYFITSRLAPNIGTIINFPSSPIVRSVG
ncbi:unnamed protein product [marine sediment metagenome]|uniref:Glycosyltransferase subfamily 4-like N-terminal domain-containing protein n=1 Tax=marine sediment metagenome TaxID=412755 RepID=X1BFH0_9ZZZZ